MAIHRFTWANAPLGKIMVTDSENLPLKISFKLN
jgi:hypothetical protein